MKLSLIALATGFSILAGATPLDGAVLLERALSPDNTCGLVNSGNNNGYTCNPALAQGGSCCSGSGYCGNGPSYCGAGCQPAYGTCGTSSSSSLPPTSSTTSSTQPVGTSTDFCGSQNGGIICAPGYCCSTSGYCGTSSAYCGSGCQTGFGSCGVSSSSTIPTSTSSTSSSSTPVGTSTDGCGSQNGGLICAPGYCCSPNGFCGTSSAYCGSGCQSAFGACGLTPSSSVSSATTPGPTGSTYLCGPGNGNAVCATGLCCSPSGYCGTGANYCTDPNCQYDFGDCDSDMTPAGTSTINDPRPLFGPISYTNDIYDCVQANAVALTYDDGPLNYTNQLLDILKQYNFKATFFITGNNDHKGMIDVTAPYPSIIKRMIAEGHQVASHTWSHYSLSSLTRPQRIQQMVKNERAIANIIGKYPTYMRPPYSDCDDASGCRADMQSLGYHITYFDLDTQDYLNPTTIQNSKDVVRWALGNATQGSDFLSIQHDVVQQSVANLSSYYFDLIQKKGWKGITVGECLGDPQTNWYRVPGTGQPAPVSLSSSIISSTKTSSSSTSKPTSTGRTTLSSAIIKTTTTSTKSVPPRTTTSKISSATAPVATPQCDQPKSGNFCGKVKSFSSQPGCQNSHTDCKAQQNTCPSKGGSRTACQNWANECTKLQRYCDQCTKKKQCDDKGFRASGE